MSFVNQNLHLVWSTKDRETLLHKSIREDLFQYIGGIAKNRKCVLLAAGGIEDHIHLLVGLDQTVAISDLVRDTKSNTSIWIKNNHPNLIGFGLSLIHI